MVSRENLGGMMVIRAFGNEGYEENRFEKANSELSKTNRFVQRTMAFMMPAMMLIMNCVTLVIVWSGSHAIADSTLQIGDMLAFMQYAMQIIMAFFNDSNDVYYGTKSFCFCSSYSRSIGY